MSIACHLTSEPNFGGSVIAINRDPSYARASSALSASAIRQQLSTPLDIHLSRFDLSFLRRAPELQPPFGQARAVRDGATAPFDYAALSIRRRTWMSARPASLIRASRLNVVILPRDKSFSRG